MVLKTPQPFITGCIAILAMVAIVFFSFFLSRPPSVIPADAPAAEFSAARAAEHLKYIAAEKHPIGSPANERVRDYLAGQLEALGVEPVIQRTEFFDQQTQRAARLSNVMGRIRGSGDGSAVMFMGHYDSVEESYGAADNGSALISMLELIRMLKHHPTMKNDLLFLFPDGEEYGLLGAKAFLAEHPWADDVKAVLNFESRGTTGASLLFETSDGNLDLVKAYSRAASKPMGNSLGYEIYSRMPTDTDFSPFKHAGHHGLNFAFIDNGFDYHTAGDRTGHLDLRSVQHHGSHISGLALHLGNHPLDFSSGKNAVFFNTFGSGFAWYPYGWAAPLAILTLLLFLAMLVAGIIKKLVHPVKILFAFMAYAVYLMVVYTIANSLFLILAGYFPGGDFRLLEFHIPELVLGFGGLIMAFTLAFFHLARTGVRIWHALVLLIVGWVLLAWSGQFSVMYAMYSLLAVLALYVLLRKPVATWDLASGSMVVWVFLTVATSFAAPGVSFLFTWPLVFALTGAAIYFLLLPGKPNLWWKPLILVAFALPVLAWFPSTAYLFTVAMGLGMIGLAFIFVGLMAGLLVPQMHLVTRAIPWVFPLVFFAVGLFFLVRGGTRLEYDQRYQKPNNILYVTDGVMGESLWVSLDKEVDAWTSQFLTETPDTIDWSRLVPPAAGSYLARPSGLQDLAVPVAELISDSVYDGQRVLSLHIRSERSAHWMYMYFKAGGSPVRMGINDAGPSLLQPLRQATWHYVPYFAFPEGGIRVELHVNPQQTVDLHLLDIIHGFPEFVDKEPRPPHKIPHRDRTVAGMRYSF
jgi:hypothetical protein